ncbi:MAG: type II toxin-antitoxin system VapC family toxin [Rickettsia endosymbiont of Glossina mortisans submortisans]|nr:type II toxin-antitoxin system VapC family toxin [Rickettsia endosymbiont of Glossina mortisans submortisans]
MIGIDTNILIRYLTGDDKVQSIKAIELIEKYSGKENSIFINNIVICELVWVLERGYKYSKGQIISVLKEIFSTVEFSFENQQVLWLSVLEYENYKTDFSDILIGKLNTFNGCNYTVTFDKAASELTMFRLLHAICS